MRQDDRELVAAQTRDRVGLAVRTARPLGGLPQHLFVTRGVAEAVVDGLEVVEIDEEQRERLRLPRRLGVPAVEPVLEDRRFGGGQRVVIRR